MSSSQIAAFLCTLFVCASASAVEPGDWYVSLQSGTESGTIAADSVTPAGSLFTSGRGRWFADHDYTAQLVVGKYLTENWRLEAQAGMSDFDAELFGDPNAGLSAFRGNILLYNFSANLLYELRYIGDIRPFLGAGIGASAVEFDHTFLTDGSGIGLDSFKAAFAPSLIFGLDIPLTEQLSLTGRYSGTYHGETTHDIFRTTNNMVVHDQLFHSITVGLQFTFPH